MTQKDLEAIRARCEAATPGPWTYTESEGYCALNSIEGCITHKSEEDEGCKTCECWRCTYPAFVPQPSVLDNSDYDGFDDVNAEFIAHARQDIPALLDELAAREARIAELERERDEAVGLVAKLVLL